jgi:peptide/nickel transport system substrate-binding protein
MRIIVTLLLSAAIASASAGCASQHVAPVQNRTLRLGFSAQFHGLNPIYNDGATGAALAALAFSYLLRPLPDGRLEPDVATAVPTLRNGGIAPDGRTITYHLRRDVRWQDGVPLTSADVAFTVRAILDPRNTIGTRNPFDRIGSVETPDPYTVRLRLHSPDASVVGLFLTPDVNAAILPAHLLARYASLDHVPYNALPVGSGPYRIVRWERGSLVRFARNPAYFGGAPKLAALELRYSPDTATTLIELQTGELDGTLVADAAFFDRYRALPGKRITNVPYVAAYVLGFNTERPLLANAAMRRALAQAVDEVALARETFRGAVTAADATRGLFSYADDPGAPWPRYDPLAAARALDALGWRRDAAGLRRRGGTALALTLVYSNVSAAYRSAAVLLQQQFARAGVRLDLQSFAYSQFYAQASDGGPVAGGRYDLALINYSTNIDPDQAWLLACRERAPRGYNWSRYCNPGADALLAASARAFDPTARVALLRRLQRLVARDVPFLPLWQAREIDVTPDWLGGFTPNGDLSFASARDWSVSASASRR